MKERLKLLRKTLKLNQNEFGQKINLSGAQIGSYETGRRDLTTRAIEDICREFNVNKDWLVNGTGEMFVLHKDKHVAEYIKSLNMSDFEMELLEKFLQFDSQTRINILEFATKTFNIPPHVKETHSLKTEVELAEEAYIKIRLNSASKTTSSVTPSIKDNDNDNVNLKVVK